MFYVYILYSSVADKNYIGHTDDPERRLTEHNEISEDTYTSKYRPWELKALFEIGEDRRLAIRVERHLKKQKNRAYLENLILTQAIDKIIKRLSSDG